LRIVDDLLIDRVHQPLVNLVQQHPVDLAMTIQLGSCVMFITGVTIGMLNDANVLMIIITILVIVFQIASALFNIFIRFPQMRPNIQPGADNPYRPRYRKSRLLFLVFVLAVTFMSVDIFIWFGCWLFVAAYYVIACSCPTPKQEPMAFS
jgi:hypothetical protein